ncbi:MAG TPA: glycine oxidase ThiO [Terriglobales bacterium]|nr:glycine oxidase ThiO [Terriglobales bacterium]
MHTSDVVIAGAGVIGLSIAIQLRKAGATVTVLDRGEPGREASSAAAGMLVTMDPDLGTPMRELAKASAALYPAFVEEVELHSGLRTDLEARGALYVAAESECLDGPIVCESELAQQEPGLAPHPRVHFLSEQSIDPALLTRAAIEAAKRLGITVHHEAQVEALTLTREHLIKVRTSAIPYETATFVNCAGAWANEIAGAAAPARPRKGQMLSVLPHDCKLRHVIRSHGIYLVPRKDGRVIIGATVEDCGFDKTIESSKIQQLHQKAANLVPSIGGAKILDAWVGLRPGSPDDLPIMGAGRLPGTYVATGHFRNGILLAPITAMLMTELIQGKKPRLNLREFSPLRFAPAQALAG